MSLEEHKQLIDNLLEGNISDVDFLRLEAAMIVNEDARLAYYERQKLHVALQIEAESQSGNQSSVSRIMQAASKPGKIDWLVATAFTTLVLFITMLVWHIRQDSKNYRQKLLEPVASGFGVFAGESNAVWANHPSLGTGDLVPQGSLILKSGIAQLELFSGVMILIEGHAEFEVISSMELSVIQGKVRAQVPDPARGFRIHTASGDAVDLGTELSIEVSMEHTDIYVVRGNAEWHPNNQVLHKLTEGESLRWDVRKAQLIAGGSPHESEPVNLGAFTQDQTNQRANRLDAWKEHSKELRSDSRLLAYFPMDQPGNWQRQLKDESGRGIHGTIIRANRTSDRWSQPFSGLDFSSTGSRVRLTIPGEHRSLTLMCWAKIDSLDRLYNSLFLTDGHELHEPHWQIMNDGRLFFSVKAVEKKGKKDKHVAYSPPIWTPAQSGQWMHIATVYDGDAATTTHYLNGKAISIDHIPEELQIKSVNIGAASIGNWSKPKRSDPNFAVRNLNGTIDEFAIFSAALNAKEINDIHDIGKP